MFDWEVEFYGPGAGNADRSDIGAQVNGTTSIPVGNNVGCFEIPLVDDDLIENSERYAVVYKNANPPGRVNFYDKTGGTSEYGGLANHRSLFGPARADRPPSSLGILDVVIEDNEQGVAFSTASLIFEEGAVTTDANRYTINLRENPDRDVTVTLSVDNPNVSITPTTLVFTSADGTVAQTVTVTATADSNISDGTAMIAHSVAGLTSADQWCRMQTRYRSRSRKRRDRPRGFWFMVAATTPTGTTNVSITLAECDAGPPSTPPNVAAAPELRPIVYLCRLSPLPVRRLRSPPQFRILIRADFRNVQFSHSPPHCNYCHIHSCELAN